MLIPNEYQECCLFWDYCQIVLKLGKKVFHHANEGKRGTGKGKNVKRIGMTKGLLDYQFLIKNDKYLGLWIEMKKKDQKGKKTKKEQDDMIEILRENGHYATYAYGADDAIAIYHAFVKNQL